MRIRDAAFLFSFAAVIAAPLACSSSSSDDGASSDNDAGDQGDTGDQTTDSGAQDSAPPFVPGAYPNSYPQVPNNSGGGGIIVNMRLVVILPSGESTVQNFGSVFPTSNVFKAVASEYGLGTPVAGTTITGGAITAGQLTATAIQDYVTTTLGSNPALAPNGSSIYLVFLPATSWLEYNGVSNQGCHQNGVADAPGVGGYHVPYGGGGDAWGVVQHCTGLQFQTDPQELEIAASHEVVEAATDVDGVSGYALPQAQPDPTQLSIWDDLLLTEIGDLCVNTQIAEGAYTYQRFWSNKAAKSSADPCIPAIPIFFNTGAVGGDTNGWFKITGTSVSIPIEGFSTAAIDPWVVASVTGSQPAQASADGWGITLTTPSTSGGQATIGNGQKGTVNITAPAGSPSGSWAEFELESASGAATGGENVHLWPIGVYVP